MIAAWFWLFYAGFEYLRCKYVVIQIVYFHDSVIPIMLFYYIALMSPGGAKQIPEPLFRRVQMCDDNH